MPLLLLLLLTVACLPENWRRVLDWGSPVRDFEVSAALTWGGVGLVVASAAAIARWVERSIRRHQDARDFVLGRYASLKFFHLLFFISFYICALYLLGWGWAVQSLSSLAGGPSPERASLMLPGTEVLLLAPFVLGLVLSWACFYGGDRALQRLSQSAEPSPAFWSRGTYVLFHLRHNLGLVAAPLVLMMAQRTLHWSLSGTTYEAVVPILVGTLLVAVFVSLPLVLRLVLGFRPMPAGLE